MSGLFYLQLIIQQKHFYHHYYQQKLIENGKDEESKILKNHCYLFYIFLTLLIVTLFLITKEFLIFIGVNSSDFPLYIPYFKLSFISILIASPWSILIPGYLRSMGESKLAMKLDHLIVYSMIIGIFVTTHIFHKDIL